ncbi:glutaredoxin family protein [Dechloromonas sp. HYN0024]|uniref:glutaredoxin family protein n=1 Tax=Dechloromonas sp. HYN0024 TaxID=2231055 RepID=UPI000E430D39|nr:glutaredoxin family protein [Dechloromonas sp. HYN0024]AXS80951.1 glutaredoxin family protein [Dechloromonas sp. HYN0024]
MRQICPHCNCARQAEDTAPDWQCPSCQRAYVKAGTPLPPAGFIQYGPATQPARSGLGKWLLILVLLGGAFLYIRPLLHPRALQPAVAGINGEQPAVVLYATSWCGYCKMTREFFAANGIRYTEQDIEQSSAAYKEHRRLGGNGVPLVVVGDQVIKGWNEGELRQLLGPWVKG